MNFVLASVSEKSRSDPRRDVLDGGRPAIHSGLNYECLARMLLDDATAAISRWVLCV